VLELELPLRHRDGHHCTVQFTITNLLDNPSVGGLVLNTRDISERRQLEDQLVHQAFHDSLTSLANRALFKDRVDHALLRTKRQTPSVAVLFLDLDGFKEVNDSLGHAAGDRLLIQVAERLHSCVRPSDTVARFGGDEFAVLIEDASDDIDIIQVAERVLDGLRQPFEVNGRELHVRGSMGIARMDGDVDGADQLLRNADLAMYRAKAAGRGGYERYDPEMHTELVQRVQLESDLRRALEAGELFLQYQPTFDLGSGQIVGAEALARWNHPARGLVAPTEFIPLAEASGLIRPLGAWVLREACRQAAEWQRNSPPREKPPTLNINLSGRQLQFPEVVDDVAQALEESGLPPSSLVLEMTESVLMDDNEDVLTILRRIKALGARLAIDDFGTGYSSLSYLHRSATPATTPSWPGRSSASARACSWSRWPRGSRTRPSSWPCAAWAATSARASTSAGRWRAGRSAACLATTSPRRPASRPPPASPAGPRRRAPGYGGGRAGAARSRRPPSG
jgi:diguanylate cyclase (GGDEF)-like protein